MIKLNAAQAERFKTDGFLIVERIVDPALADSAAARFAPMFRGEFEPGVLPDEVNWQEGRDADDLTRQICNGWKGDRAIASVVLREDIGRACAILAGWSGARIMQDNVLWKPPGARPLGFHQDNSYLEWLAPQELQSYWIALDDTTDEGGTMELVRGSHRWASSPPARQFHGPEAYRAEMEAAAARAGVEPDIVPVVVPRGGGVFHHGWSWHGSGFNNSQQPRRTLVLHAIPSQAHYVKANFSQGIHGIYGRYRRFADDRLDENHFPILWSEAGGRTPGLDDYLRI